MTEKEEEEVIHGSIVAKKIHQLREKVKEIKASKMKTDRISYNYLSEAELTKALRPAMQELGLVMLPINSYYQTENNDMLSLDREGKEVTKTNLLTSMETSYRIYDIDSGDYLDIVSVGAGTDTMDKGMNKASTCCFKNALRTLGMFPSPDRDDPDTTASSGGKTESYNSDPAKLVIKWGDHAGKTLQEVFDENPDEVEKLANGKSKWIAGKAQEFLKNVK